MSKEGGWGERTCQGIYKDFVEPVTSWFTSMSQGFAGNNVHPLGGDKMKRGRRGINMNDFAKKIALLESGKEEVSIAQVKEILNKINCQYKKMFRCGEGADVLATIERTTLPRGRPKNGNK